MAKYAAAYTAFYLKRNNLFVTLLRGNDTASGHLGIRKHYFKQQILGQFSFTYTEVSWLTHLLLGIKAQFTLSFFWFWPRDIKDKDLERIRNNSKLQCDVIGKNKMSLTLTSFFCFLKSCF